MRRINTSHAALAVAGAALFVALGGPAWAKGVLVGAHQLKNNAVTSRKIAKGAVHNADLAKGAVRGVNIKKATITGGRLAAKAVTTSKLGDGSVTNGKLGDGSVTNGKLGNAAVTTTKLADASVTTGKLADQSVTTGKLADNAVTSAKVQDASLTATDVAPNTFLAANGTAVNALALGGIPASGYAQQAAKRVVVGADGPSQNLAVIPTGFLRATCPGNAPRISYDNASTPVDYGETDIRTPASAVHFTTLNNIGANSGDVITGPSGGAVTVTMQIASKSDLRQTTAWITGHDEAQTCIFTAQAISTG